jgi:hypothetical protein
MTHFLLRHKAVLLFVTLMVILVCGVLIWPFLRLGRALFFVTTEEYANRRAFDAALWQDPGQVDNGIRIRMVDDLLTRQQLQGMTHEQIVELLGNPEETPYFREWDLVYWLGPERGFFSIDSAWLVIRLDPQGRVSEYRLVTD